MTAADPSIAELGTSTAARAAEVLVAHFWADLAGSCVCGWRPDGHRRSWRYEHAAHVAQRLSTHGLLVGAEAVR